MCERGGASTSEARRGRQPGMARSLILAAAVALAPTLAVAQGFVFDRLEVQGTQRIQPATVAEIAGIPRGEAIGAAQVNEALQNLQNSGLFEEVEVIPQGRTLIVRVAEYPTINVIAFEGNRALSDDELREVVQSQSRRVFSPSRAEADAALIAEGYRQQGRVAAAVAPRIIRRSDNRVDLVFEIEEGRVTETERISFVGNRAYSDRRLRRVIESRQAGLLRAFIRADTLVEERVQFDRQLLTDFYQSRGYIDFQVLSATPQIARGRDAFTITFTVREGQQFRVGDVDVTSEIAGLDAGAYDDAIRLREGVVYSPALVERDIARLERLAVREGRNFVRVEPRLTRNDRDLTLDVEYVLTRGPRVFVERIDIEGNTATLDRVVRRQFDVVEGDPFNPREIRAAAERIEALGFFANTDVNTREGTAPDQVIVDVDVEEQPTGSLGFGANYSTTDGLGFRVNFSERNFLGRGQGLSFDLTATADTSSFGFSFVEPAFLGRDLTFGVSAFYRESEQNFTRFNTRRATIAPRLAFPLSDSTRLEVRTAVGYAEVFDVDLGFPEDSDETGDTGSSAILREEEELGGLYTYALGYSLSYDTRRIGLDPTAGLLLRFSQDFGVRDDEATFVRSEFLARARKDIFNEEVTLRAEFEAGALAYSGGNSIVTERFSLSRNMRGFEPNGLGPRDLNVDNEDPLGGNLYTVARFEADFPLGLPEEYGINAGIFYDVGSVWSLDNTSGGPDGDQEVDDSLIWRSAAGFSIFWDTALGPLRFNFSRPIMIEDYDEEQNFEFTVSTRF